MEKQLDSNQINELRQNGSLSEKEVAILEGDLILAKNVITQERRIIGKINDILIESKKRILKG